MMNEMRTMLMASLLVMSSFGCAGSSIVQTKQAAASCAPQRHGHELAVTLSVERGAGRRALCPGERLSSADALFIAVEIASAAYVRLVLVAANGHASELLPEENDQATHRASFQSPAGMLANASGEAQLFLVASLHPLSRTDPVMQDLLDAIRDTTGVSPEQATSPASESPETLHLESQADLAADFDENGLVMMAIALHTSP
jgi:hypothetical protein